MTLAKASVTVSFSVGFARLLHCGDFPDDVGAENEQRLVEALKQSNPVVVDCGSLSSRVGLDSQIGLSTASASDISLLVLRPCYLALRRALALPMRPTGVVLIREPGRALVRRDIEDVLGVPVCAEVPYDPAIARSVDAGLITRRLPRQLERALGGVVSEAAGSLVVG